jgi:hypothetical protein
MFNEFFFNPIGKNTFEEGVPYHCLLTLGESLSMLVKPVSHFLFKKNASRSVPPPLGITSNLGTFHIKGFKKTHKFNQPGALSKRVFVWFPASIPFEKPATRTHTHTGWGTSRAKQWYEVLLLYQSSKLKGHRTTALNGRRGKGIGNRHPLLDWTRPSRLINGRSALHRSSGKTLCSVKRQALDQAVQEASVGEDPLGIGSVGSETRAAPLSLQSWFRNGSGRKNILREQTPAAPHRVGRILSHSPRFFGTTGP